MSDQTNPLHPRLRERRDYYSQPSRLALLLGTALTAAVPSAYAEDFFEEYPDLLTAPEQNPGSASVLNSALSIEEEKAKVVYESAVLPVTVSVAGQSETYYSYDPEATVIPVSYDEAESEPSDIERFKRFFHLMLDEGVYLAPSAFESGFTSTAHTEADIEATLNAAEDTFKQMSN